MAGPRLRSQEQGVSHGKRGHTTVTPSRPATAKLRVVVTAMTPTHRALLPHAAALTWRGASLRMPTSLVGLGSKAAWGRQVRRLFIVTLICLFCGQCACVYVCVAVCMCVLHMGS